MPTSHDEASAGNKRRLARVREESSLIDFDLLRGAKTSAVQLWRHEARKDPVEPLNLTPEQRAADLLGKRDVDVLRSMLSLFYDAAIQAQFDEHIGAEPHERSPNRRDQGNGTRDKGGTPLQIADQRVVHGA